MDYAAVAKEAGGRPEAIEDITRRLEARFQDETPSPEAVKEWVEQTLKPTAAHLFAPAQTLWAKLGMDKATFDAMPPSWRLGQAMAQQAQTTSPHPRRPQPREVPADVASSWQVLPAAERLTKYRAWRDAQG